MKRLLAIAWVLVSFCLLACTSSSSNASSVDAVENNPELPESTDVVTASDDIVETRDVAIAPDGIDETPDVAIAPEDTGETLDVPIAPEDIAVIPDMDSGVDSAGPMDVPVLQDITDTGPTSACLGTEEAFELPLSVVFDDDPGSFLETYQSVSLIDVKPGLGVGEHTFLVRLWNYVECLDGGCDWDSGAQSPPGVTGAIFITDSSCANNVPCTNTWHHQDAFAATTSVQVAELGNGYYQVSGLLVPSAGSWEFRFAVEGWPVAVFHFCVTDETIPGGNVEDWAAEANPSDATDGIDISDFGEDFSGGGGASGADGTDSAT
jgi:hypothetical protein